MILFTGRYAHGSPAHQLMIVHRNHSSGWRIQPKKMPICIKNNPPMQTSRPSPIKTPSRGTNIMLARGEIKEIRRKLIAMMGHVAVWAVRVTVIISATRRPKGMRPSGRNKCKENGVSITMPSVPRQESWKPTSHNIKGSIILINRAVSARVVYTL